MSKVLKAIRYWWWKLLIVALAIFIHINIAGCYRMFFRSVIPSDIPIDISAQRFETRFAQLQQEFGEDIVILEEIRKQDDPKEVHLNGVIRLPDETGEIDISLSNYGGVYSREDGKYLSGSAESGEEIYGIDIITKPIYGAKKSLPSDEALEIAARTVEILSGGEVEYETMLEDLKIAKSSSAYDYSDPEYMARFQEIEYRFWPYQIGDSFHDGFSIDLYRTERGEFYTKTVMLFCCYEY